MDQQHEVALLKLPTGNEVKLNVLKPSSGDEIVLDIRELRARAGCITFDPGFSSTAMCRSAITYIDGEQGLCLYRGYPVHEIVHNHDYLAVCYLLLYGELASPTEFLKFERRVKDELLVHERLKRFFEGFIDGTHPMAILDSMVSALASFYCNPVELLHEVEEEKDICIARLIAKMATIAAMAYKVSVGEPFVYPRTDLTYAENLLNMMFSKPTEPFEINPLHAKFINIFLIVHADHEQAASTSTVRIAGSSGASPYACISAGITSLWGRAHGGANEAVMRMLKEIGTVEEIPKFIQEVKDKKRRLMGFGHRVYRNYDPRARLMRGFCIELLEEQKGNDPLFELAMELEKIALEDEYFLSRKLYPNVDFYSGIALRAIGIPDSMFTVIFALGRTPGWLSHWNEMMRDPSIRISRPRQLYCGYVKRSLMQTNGTAVDINDKIKERQGVNKGYKQSTSESYFRDTSPIYDYDFDLWGERSLEPHIERSDE